jgi:tRNA (guanine10-N2)-methyltransferase
MVETKATPTQNTTGCDGEEFDDNHDEDEDAVYRVLVEFVYKHLDFQMAELESILDMYGIQIGSPNCTIRPLPVTPARAKDEDGLDTRYGPLQSRRAFCLLEFPIDHAERLSARCPAEALAAKSSNGSKSPPEFDPTVNVIPNKLSTGAGPGIAEMLSKCTLVKSIVELWAYSTVSLEDCASRAHRWLHRPSSASIMSEMCHSQQHSWKLTVQTLGTKFTRPEQDAMRGTFAPTLDLIQGPVQLSNPTNELFLIREIELDGKGSPVVPPQPTLLGTESGGDVRAQHHQTDSQLHPSTPAPPALAYYFGRVLGGTPKDSRGVDRFTLKKRPYLGPTSMDAELSFVMTSLGQVQRGTIVYDPFVGTGSILLACALRGAYCIGSDIDIRVLRGKGGDETIWKNFELYGLPRPEILRTDNSVYQKHFRHCPHRRHDDGGSGGASAKTTSTLYDAILCDPPYGIRAGARKTGSKLDQPRQILDEHRHDHIAQTRAYPVSDVMSDLLDVAAQTLNLGGRLVYVIPSFRDFDPEKDLPRHDCLELLHCCYQPFTVELGRRIVAMKKIADYDTSKRGDYLSSIWLHGAESAEKCANIRDKIIEAAKLKPDYERRAAVRREKRKAHKEAKRQEKRSKGDAAGSSSSSSTKGLMETEPGTA